MIQSEEILRFIQKDAEKPVTIEEIIDYFSIQASERDNLQQVLIALEAEGKIVRTRKKRYGAPERMNLVSGRLQGHPKGFGFVLVKDGEDVYVSADQMNGAMHNDLVMVRLHRQLSGQKRSREGVVVRILKRANEQVVGIYSGSKRYGFVVPEEKRIFQDIFIPGQASGGAQDGDLVVAKITQWPQERRSPEGEVVEVLGNKGEPGVDVLAIVKKFGLPTQFPAAVQKEAEQISNRVLPEEVQERLDLRHMSIVTIDSEDAKDLDDGISIEKRGNGNYLLGVHIADVAHYVREGSWLDREARARGCSVYLVDRVIPMLPPSLSNSICSLNATEDRLALSAFIEVDPKGSVVAHEFRETAISISQRLSYNIVKAIVVDKEEEMRAQYRELVPELELMARLCQILQERRLQRGAIDFNFREKKVIIDENGRPVAIEQRERSLADQIVEEFMLLANEVVAEHVYWLNLPFVYRIHEQPEDDAIVNLRDFLYNLGYPLPGRKKVTPKAFQDILHAVKGKPEERIINEVVLRSLKRARYAADCLGHFGLAAKFYTHFTSPIRRYPDLLVHRVIKGMLKGQLSSAWLERQGEMLPTLAQEASVRERIAEEAEQESIDLKVVEYMVDKVGEVFPGVVSGVTPFGVFVELPNGVEGLVHVSNMTDDYYQYVEKQLILQGERTKKRYRIGDPVTVQVTRVNLAERTIDMEFVPYSETGD
ncbi:MAG: ribonuclease R [bacterium]